MIDARVFTDAALARGYRWYTGVPCSFLTPFINEAIQDHRLNHVPAPNEGDAVALAAGLWTGGQRAVVMMQNSGLGNAVSPLSSLTAVFGIPVLLICTHRGAPDVADEPQHALMGQITTEMLELLQIPWEAFPTTEAGVPAALDRADQHFLAHGSAYALVMAKGSVAERSLPPSAPAPPPSPTTPTGKFRAAEGEPTREAVLTAILRATSPANSVVIATTGYTGRELFALDDRANHFYMVGSMGCASAFGVGLALARPDLHVVVVDGDGAALMRLGNLALVGGARLPNFSHILLDNQMHESTGGQPSLATHVDFATLAAGSGYAGAERGDSIEDLTAFLAAPRSDGARFLHLRTRPGTPKSLPRPTVTPPAVLARLRHHLGVAD